MHRQHDVHFLRLSPAAGGWRLQAKQHQPPYIA